MRHTIILICLLVVLTASVASGQTWTSNLWTTVGAPPIVDMSRWIGVVTTATDMDTYWHWSYAITPQGVSNIRALTITLGSPAAMVTNVTGPADWSVGIVSGGAVYWQTTGDGLYTLDAGETFTYGFDHPWGPSAGYTASALNGSGYSGPVRGPAAAVPEPMSIVFAIMGMSGIAGWRKLSGK